MDELRRDLNAAFDNEQSELGNLAGTRNRLMRNALAARETRSGARLQLAAGIAAVVIAAALIGPHPPSRRPRRERAPLQLR